MVCSLVCKRRKYGNVKKSGKNSKREKKYPDFVCSTFTYVLEWSDMSTPGFLL
jgi:hypothetical protein